MIVTQTVHVPDDAPGVYHIPGVHNTQVTLCGFVDVMNDSVDAEEHPCNCPACIAAFKKIKSMKFPRYYFTDAAVTEEPPPRVRRMDRKG